MLGLFAKFIGIILCIMGFMTLFYGYSLPQPLSAIISFVGLFIMAMGFTFLTANRPINTSRLPPPPTFTEVRCDSKNCDFKEIRNFERGDYILKALNIHCPKCGSGLTIHGIYTIKEEKDQAPS